MSFDETKIRGLFTLGVELGRAKLVMGGFELEDAFIDLVSNMVAIIVLGKSKKIDVKPVLMRALLATAVGAGVPYTKEEIDNES